MSVTGRIYLDNAATSWPKPDTVYQAMGMNDLMAYDKLNRPYYLLEDSHPLTSLF